MRFLEGVEDGILIAQEGGRYLNGSKHVSGAIGRRRWAERSLQLRGRLWWCVGDNCEMEGRRG